MHHYTTDRHIVDKRKLSAAQVTLAVISEESHISQAKFGGAFEMGRGRLTSYKVISVEMFMTFWMQLLNWDAALVSIQLAVITRRHNIFTFYRTVNAPCPHMLTGNGLFVFFALDRSVNLSINNKKMGINT